jgi:acyl-CoA thioester hydrolase
MNPTHTIQFRVRYPECDAMGYLHHSRHFQYFEMGRIELLRTMGHSYSEFEMHGVFFAVVKADCKYKSPARFDDELTLVTSIVKQTRVRIDHTYVLRRGEIIVAEAGTTIACVNREGELCPIPDSLCPVLQ